MSSYGACNDADPLLVSGLGFGCTHLLRYCCPLFCSTTIILQV